MVDGDTRVRIGTWSCTTDALASGADCVATAPGNSIDSCKAELHAQTVGTITEIRQRHFGGELGTSWQWECAAVDTDASFSFTPPPGSSLETVPPVSVTATVSGSGQETVSNAGTVTHDLITATVDGRLVSFANSSVYEVDGNYGLRCRPAYALQTGSWNGTLTSVGL